MKSSIITLLLTTTSLVSAYRLVCRGCCGVPKQTKEVYYGKLGGLSPADLDAVTKMKLCGLPVQAPPQSSNKILQKYIENYAKGDIETAQQFANELGGLVYMKRIL
jgi:hypothetical protein